MKAEDIAEAYENPEKQRWAYNGRELPVVFEETSLSDASWYVASRDAYGSPDMLILAGSWESAYEAWIDESPTITEDELPEAYLVPGADSYQTFDDLARENLEKLNPKTEGESWEAYHARVVAEGLRLLRALPNDACPELAEGYRYQSNFTGTGIVDGGHYETMSEIDSEDVEWIGPEVKKPT